MAPEVLTPAGVIAGGWAYVGAAYGITLAVLLLYGWSLGRRRRQARAALAAGRAGRPDTEEGVA